MQKGSPMNRLVAIAMIGLVMLPMLGAQEPRQGTQPEGPRGGPVEVIHALLLQAQVMEGERIMFCFPRGDEEPIIVTKVDGKHVRAIDADQKPLDFEELTERLPGWTGVLVVQAEYELDPFFTKLVSDHGVVFLLPKKMFAEMAAASKYRRAPGEPPP
jgi:hypothetical protein